MKAKFEILKQNLISFLIKSRLPLFSHPKFIALLEHLLTLNFIRYLIVGFTTFGLDFGLFHIFDTYTPLKGLPANMTTTLMSLSFNFYMSNFWTFKVGGKDKVKKLQRYSILAVFNYIFTNIFFYVVNVLFGVNAIVTKVIATGIIVCWNYFIYKLWVFKNEQD